MRVPVKGKSESRTNVEDLIRSKMNLLTDEVLRFGRRVWVVEIIWSDGELSSDVPQPGPYIDIADSCVPFIHWVFLYFFRSFIIVLGFFCPSSALHTSNSWCSLAHTIRIFLYCTSIHWYQSSLSHCRTLLWCSVPCRPRCFLAILSLSVCIINLLHNERPMFRLGRLSYNCLVNSALQLKNERPERRYWYTKCPYKTLHGMHYNSALV